MATDLHVEGPFDIPFETNDKNTKRVTTTSGNQFWSDSHITHLQRKQGCYVFCIRAGKGFKPWYVGKASKGFKQELFTPHKREHFNAALHKVHRGNPVVFFVTPMGNARKVPASELNHLEKELTQYAIKKNPSLTNVQNTKNVPQWSIKGIVRSSGGRPTKETSMFKTMMGM